MNVRLLRPRGPHERRSPEQLWNQYVVEKELAAALRNADESDRSRLYTAAYEELFRRIPDHSQLTYKASEADRDRRIQAQISLLEPWLDSSTVFLEIGAGDCALSLAVAERVARVYALDVSPSIMQADQVPANFQHVISDGTSVPVPRGTVTVAYSNQLMEHLHPDDALRQLSNIHEALAPGGVYICLTPNRLTGPHDISRYFDRVATGFHLKEYTCGELVGIFRQAGFRTVRQCLRWRNKYATVPNVTVRSIEEAIGKLPAQTQIRMADSRIVRGLLEIRLIAQK